MQKRNFQVYAPSVPKPYLLLIAALVWSIASGILLSKAFVYMNFDQKYIFIYLIMCVIGGIVFYKFLFSKIADKHIKRLIELPKERYCAFSFFTFRSYILMTLMVSMGVFLRKSHLVELPNLAFLYFTMGIPLGISAFRFLKEGILRFNAYKQI